MKKLCEKALLLIDAYNKDDGVSWKLIALFNPPLPDSIISSKVTQKLKIEWVELSNNYESEDVLGITKAMEVEIHGCNCKIPFYIIGEMNMIDVIVGWIDWIFSVKNLFKRVEL